MGEDELYLQYRRFKDINTGGANDQLVRSMFQDMLQIEGALVFGDAIGEVQDFEFSFKVTDPTPIRHKPITYAREEREFIRDDMAKMCRLGIVKKVEPGDPEPVFVVGIVLVKEGQSQKKYRVCANFVEPN